MKNQYLISIPEAAKQFGIGRNRLYELVYSDPTIPKISVGEYTKLNKRLFEQWIDKATQEGKAI
jgi:predicted DNA-binding transcriptional regulator AlpA